MAYLRQSMLALLAALAFLITVSAAPTKSDINNPALSESLSEARGSCEEVAVLTAKPNLYASSLHRKPKQRHIRFKYQQR